MATLTASHFVSRTSHVNGTQESSGSETKSLAQIGLRGQRATHNGLRRLSARTTVGRSKGYKSENGKGLPSGAIVCRSGMNLVFVGCEVGPWSKTGGLGDVLGGLPPAMAVSVDDFFFLIFFFTSRVCCRVMIVYGGCVGSWAQGYVCESTL